MKKPPKVQQTARLHEKSVKAIAKGTVKKPKKRGPIQVQRNSSIDNDKVHESVLETAKLLANGDPSLILILSSRDVIVMSYPGQFTKKFWKS